MIEANAHGIFILYETMWIRIQPLGFADGKLQSYAYSKRF
jgi:hypothetical protein